MSAAVAWSSEPTDPPSSVCPSKTRPELGVPTIGYGPGNEKVAHARDEYVETSHLAEAIYGNAAIVHSLVGVPVYGWSTDEI